MIWVDVWGGRHSDTNMIQVLCIEEYRITNGLALGVRSVMSSPRQSVQSAAASRSMMVSAAHVHGAWSATSATHQSARGMSLGDDSLLEASWCAFYADCKHELKPVKTSYTIALVYNSCRPSAVCRSFMVPAPPV